MKKDTMLIEIDKRVRIHLENITNEERNGIIQMFSMARKKATEKDYTLILLLSVIRNVYMQNQLYKSQLLIINNRLEYLESKTELR